MRRRIWFYAEEVYISASRIKAVSMSLKNVDLEKFGNFFYLFCSFKWLICTSKIVSHFCMNLFNYVLIMHLLGGRKFLIQQYVGSTHAVNKHFGSVIQIEFYFVYFVLLFFFFCCQKCLQKSLAQFISNQQVAIYSTTRNTLFLTHFHNRP